MELLDFEGENPYFEEDLPAEVWALIQRWEELDESFDPDA